MTKSYIFVYIAVLALVSLTSIRADTPANCTYEDIAGSWVFHEGPRGNDKTLDCSKNVSIVSGYNVKLLFPDVAVDDDGNTGFWTIIYNQGFEVVIKNRKYFAFSLYEQNGTNVTSYCGHTKWGWAHGTGVNPSDWSCTIGARTDTKKDTKKVNKLSITEDFRNL